MLDPCLVICLLLNCSFFYFTSFIVLFRGIVYFQGKERTAQDGDRDVNKMFYGWFILMLSFDVFEGR